jgi:hypothetical protein
MIFTDSLVTGVTIMKVCVQCGQELPLDRYYVHPTTGRPRAKCKQCICDDEKARYRKDPERVRSRLRERYRTSAEVRAKTREYNRNWAERNPERHKQAQRRSWLKRKYAVTVEWYDAAMEAQDGRCRVCKSKPDHLVVDHCHRTGAVRGLLCHGCNVALGFLEEDPDRAIALAEYILQFRDALTEARSV